MPLAVSRPVSPRLARIGLGISLALVAGLLGSCAKKRSIPVPPPPAHPAPAPQPPPIAPPPSVATPPPATERIAPAPPPGCIPDEIAPWWRCFHESDNSAGLVYYLFLPPTIVADATLPIVTFLHGSSGSGPGDGKPLVGGHRYATALWVRDDIQALHPSIVLVPQANPPPGETWVRFWRQPSPGDPRPKEALVLVMEILEALKARYPVDARRLYLTGQSMGGFGAWLAYTRYPGYFAAIVPVCGGGDPASVVPNPTAVWAFHGAKDRVVPIARTLEMLDAIRGAGGDPRFREYPDLDHNIFDETFTDPALAAWLFAQHLPE